MRGSYQEPSVVAMVETTIVFGTEKPEYRMVPEHSRTKPAFRIVQRPEADPGTKVTVQSLSSNEPSRPFRQIRKIAYGSSTSRFRFRPDSTRFLATCDVGSSLPPRGFLSHAACSTSQTGRFADNFRIVADPVAVESVGESQQGSDACLLTGTWNLTMSLQRSERAMTTLDQLLNGFYPSQNQERP